MTSLGLEGGLVEQRIAEALQCNLRYASLCGVLLQGREEFTDMELYTTIANLSYKGVCVCMYLHYSGVGCICDSYFNTSAGYCYHYWHTIVVRVIFVCAL